MNRRSLRYETRMKTFFAGMIATVVLIGLAAFAFALAGFIPSNADAKPSRAERWFAMTALHAAVRREAPVGENPLPPNDENMLAGIRLYREDCAVCHGGANAKASDIAQGLYQEPPQLAKHGVEDDSAGETYWKITHGIRLTGMPGFSKTLSDTQRRQITLFLQHMDRLSPAAQAAWEKV